MYRMNSVRVLKMTERYKVQSGFIVRLYFDYYCGLINNYADKFFDMLLNTSADVKISDDCNGLYIDIDIDTIKMLSDKNLDFHKECESISFYDYITTNEFCCLYEDFYIINIDDIRKEIYMKCS